MARKPEIELRSFCVRRVVDHEVTDEDLVVVLRPRYMSGPLAWWLQPRLRKPHFHVRLDQVGSFVWRLCDGEHTVAQIVEAMEQQFGESMDKALPRLRLFLGEMERGKMVQLVPPAEREAGAGNAERGAGSGERGTMGS